MASADGRRLRRHVDVGECEARRVAITAALGASVQSKIAFGPRAGQYVRKIGKGFGLEEETPLVKGTKCATINGFNLQAAPFVGALQRQRLEELVVARTPAHRACRPLAWLSGFNGTELAAFTNAHIEQLPFVRTDGGLDIKQGNAQSDVVIKQKIMSNDRIVQDQWLKLVNRAISNMKASLLGVYHGVSPKHLGRYLSEYCYRTNRRHWREEIQVRLLKACLASGPVRPSETSA